mmetsp:Transcript_30866/g.102800  ORF Transcript_30866/g.102800 Transcript_30866/m.102800 type:complete len:202 (+) Transcript_30866:40-645(+)
MSCDSRDPKPNPPASAEPITPHLVSGLSTGNSWPHPCLRHCCLHWHRPSQQHPEHRCMASRPSNLGRRLALIRTHLRLRSKVLQKALHDPRLALRGCQVQQALPMVWRNMIDVPATPRRRHRSLGCRRGLCHGKLCGSQLWQQHLPSSRQCGIHQPPQDFQVQSALLRWMLPVAEQPVRARLNALLLVRQLHCVMLEMVFQ